MFGTSVVCYRSTAGAVRCEVLENQDCGVRNFLESARKRLGDQSRQRLECLMKGRTGRCREVAVVASSMGGGALQNVAEGVTVCPGLRIQPGATSFAT
jgi:hypothetical protein